MSSFKEARHLERGCVLVVGGMSLWNGHIFVGRCVSLLEDAHRCRVMEWVMSFLEGAFPCGRGNVIV